MLKLLKVILFYPYTLDILYIIARISLSTLKTTSFLLFITLHWLSHRLLYYSQTKTAAERERHSYFEILDRFHPSINWTMLWWIYFSKLVFCYLEDVELISDGRGRIGLVLTFFVIFAGSTCETDIETDLLKWRWLMNGGLFLKHILNKFSTSDIAYSSSIEAVKSDRY